MIQNNTKQTLILFRTPLQADDTLRDIVEILGYSPHVIHDPVLNIIPLTFDPVEITNEIFVFTSVHAVSVFYDKTNIIGSAICVGEKVAQKATEYGYTIIGVYKTAGDLLHHGLPEHTLYIRGAEMAVDLKSDAKKHAINLKERIVYCQKWNPPRKTTIDTMKTTPTIVPLYSENMARCFVNSLRGQKTQAQIIAISPKVAKLIPDHIIAKCHISKEPTSKLIVQKITQLLHK